MKLVVRVIAKQINGKTPFKSYSVLTSAGNWYRTAVISKEELAKHEQKVVTLEVSRKFVKDIINKDGELVHMPTLVIESISEPTEQELKEFNEKMDKLNRATLADVN